MDTSLTGDRKAMRDVNSAFVGTQHRRATTNHVLRRKVHPLQDAFGQSATPIPESFPTSTITADSISSTNFEPVLPDMSVLIGMGSVVVLCVVAAFVWASQVVPVSRTKLALSKKQGGEVRQYLDELNESDERRAEKWLFSDWLNKKQTKKDPALPILPKAKWNSGDNPVLVTSALLMVGVLIAAATERVGIVL